METSTKKDKIKGSKFLLEILVSEEGEATLAEVEISVNIMRALGMPKKVVISDDSKRKTDIFTERKQRIYQMAPERANAFAIARDPQHYHVNFDGGDSLYEFPIQFYEVNKDSLREALHNSSLI